MLWRSDETGLELDEWTRELRLDGVALNLPPKCFELLLFLAHNSERVVSRRELFEAVWPGVQVTQSSLNQVVSLLRGALGRDAPRVLRTVRGSGYQLTTFCRVRRKSDVVPTPRRPVDGENDLQALCTAAIDCLERTTEALRAILFSCGTGSDESVSIATRPPQ